MKIYNFKRIVYSAADFLSIIWSRKSEVYKFRVVDVWLHCLEKRQSLPDMSEEPYALDGLKKITIQDVSIYWPMLAPSHDLPWLYHEVFDPFRSNPSSYDHPHLSLNDAEWIIDAGAAEGFFSVFCQKKAPDFCKIIAVEPVAAMYAALTTTLSSNPKRSIEVLKVALSDKTGAASIDADNNHLSDTKVIELAYKDFSEEMTEIVELTTIDNIVSQRELFGRGVIKMDIEGFEMKALRGAVSMLRTQKPFLAIAVYHDYNNAMECASIIRTANPDYQVEFRGFYGYFSPARPYMLFAY